MRVIGRCDLTWHARRARDTGRLCGRFGWVGRGEGGGGRGVPAWGDKARGRKCG